MLRTPLVLCGMKHCGKTTHGKLLAAALGGVFIDSDDVLSGRYAELSGEYLTPRDIFRKYGEDSFRRLEAEVIGALALNTAPDRVLALGGGVPSNAYLAPGTLKKLGFFIYLEVAPELAFERIAAGGLPPFLASEPEPYTAFLKIYREREAAYQACADLFFPIPGDEEAAAVSERLQDVLAEMGKI